MFLHLILHKT